jgi:hypothetical protein
VTLRDAYRLALLTFLGAAYSVTMYGGHSGVGLWTTGVAFGASATAIAYELADGLRRSRTPR